MSIRGGSYLLLARRDGLLVVVRDLRHRPEDDRLAGLGHQQVRHRPGVGRARRGLEATQPEVIKVI